MHGPGWPAWEPKWPNRVVPVLDTIAMSLRPRRAAKWRKARDAGLAMWEPANITFKVVEQTPFGYPKIDKSRLSEPGYLDTMIVPGYLRLMRASTTRVSTNPEGFAWWIWPSQGGGVGAVAGLQISVVFWLRTAGRKAYLVGHEVGHCLGLSHRPAGWGRASAGIMGTGVRPDEHDLDSVRNWDYK